MTTFQELIDETRQHLMTGKSDRLNILNTTVDDDDTSIVFQYENKGAGEGTILVIGIEEMFVLNMSETGGITTLTVIRGYNGSVKVAHTAGDIIHVNPQFSNFRIARFVNQAFYNLSGDGLFRVVTTELVSNALLLGYDVGSLPHFITPWRVRYSISGSTQAWPVMRHDQYYLDRAADTTSFPSGKALFLREGVASGQTVSLSYRAGFDVCSNVTDDVEDVTGLHVEAHDLPPLDAAISILAGREVKRTFLNRQPEPRRQEEVPVGGATQAMTALVRRYEDRMIQERTRLQRLYPTGI